MLRRGARCTADPTLDPAAAVLLRVADPGAETYSSADNSGSSGDGGRKCGDYSKLYAWAEAHRADDSSGLGVDFGPLGAG